MSNTWAAGMGLVGALKNAGKVAGPVLAGGLIHWLDYALTFQLMAAGLLVGAIVVWQGARLARRPRREREAVVV